MIAVDTNILVYAHREESPFYGSAAACVARLAEGKADWAIPFPCLHEFLSVATHPRIYVPPTPLPRAIDQIDSWLESPSLHLLAEAPRYWSVLRPMLLSGQIVGPQVHDGRVAALCHQHGVRELWSADRDFGRFRGLKVVNPLIG